MAYRTVKLSVMIVDNSDEVLSALSSVIDGQPDLDVVGVAGGVVEGVMLAKQVQPDVVILDVNMPEGGGQRAAREISAAVPGVRIVAFSAFDKALIRKMMLSAGADAYVSKSASIPELLAAIRDGSQLAGI